MKLKKLFPLVFVLIVLIIIAIVHTFMSRPEPMWNNPFTDLDPDKLSKIAITNDNHSIILEKDINSNWNIVVPFQYKADTLIIADLLNGLREFRTGEIISKNNSKYSQFHVDKTNGIILQAYYHGSSDPSVLITLGKNSSDYFSHYVLIDKGGPVYISKGITRRMFKQNINMYRDKGILSFDINKVNKIGLFHSNKSFIIIKKQDNTWQVGKQLNNLEDADTVEVMNYLDSILKLNADAFADDEEIKALKDTDTSKPELKITVTTEEDEAALIIAGKKDYSYYVKTDNNALVFLIQTRVIDSLKKNISDFKNKTLENNANNN